MLANCVLWYTHITNIQRDANIVMLLNLDNYLSVHSTSVNLRAQRASVLANNLANSDTPNFKARDISFKESLISATKSNGSNSLSVPISSSHASHLSVANPTSNDLLYRVPTQDSLDGNTVQTDVENSVFAENSVRYETSLRFLNGKITGLLKAIKGE